MSISFVCSDMIWFITLKRCSFPRKVLLRSLSSNHQCFSLQAPQRHRYRTSYLPFNQCIELFHTHHRTLALLRYNNTPKQHFSSTSSNETPTSKSTSPRPLSLRRLASPFLLLCHPDKFSHIELARKVNLNAIQILNGFMDAIELVSDDPAKRGVIESEYVIEFMVPSGKGKEEKNTTTCTRREVILTFPKQYKHGSSNALKQRAKSQILKLLRAASLPLPLNGRDDDSEKQEDAIWMEQMGIQRKLSPFEKSRLRFVRQIDWVEMDKRHERALESYRADLATTGMIDKPQKQKLLTELISRIRIQTPTQEAKDSQDQNPCSDDFLRQLVTLRRITLLLEDNYNELRMEDMARLYEKLVIVLYGENSEKKGGDSGFKFTWDGSDGVVVTIPMDFRNEELVEELNSNLPNFYMAQDDDFVVLCQ